MYKETEARQACAPPLKRYSKQKDWTSDSQTPSVVVTTAHRSIKTPVIWPRKVWTVLMWGLFNASGPWDGEAASQQQIKGLPVLAASL